MGIDAGTTTGIAVLSTSGNLIKLVSIRNAKTSEIIIEILKYGYPIIIASDVCNVPKKISFIARNLDAKLYKPEKVITELEKTSLTQKYKYESTHERDALASAIKAYRKYENLLRKLSSRKVEELHIREVFKGKSLAVARRQKESV